jgi:hypothetical protein
MPQLCEIINLVLKRKEKKRKEKKNPIDSPIAQIRTKSLNLVHMHALARDAIGFTQI